MSRTPSEQDTLRNRIRLTVLSGRNAGTVYESSSDRVSIGRGDRNDLRLTEPHISLQHGEIRPAPGGGYLYRDLRSTNGSMVQRDAERVLLNEENHHETALRPGDRIVMGDARAPVTIRFEPFDAQTAPAPDRTVAASCALDRVGDIRDVLMRDRRTLARMYRFLEDLQPLSGTKELFRSTLDLVRSHFPGASHVGIYVRDAGQDRFTPLLEDCAARPEEPPLPLSRAVQEQVLATQRSLLVENARAEHPDAHTLAVSRIRSLLCAPLWNRGHISGVIQVANELGRPAFSSTDLEVLTVFAHQVALAFERVRNIEILEASDRMAREENAYLTSLLEDRFAFDRIVGCGPAMQQVFALMKKAAAHDLPVLILGETGTGKELVARAIHHNGPRRARRFVPVNCGAIAETLFESELFGHVRGAFTGAHADKKGLMAEADGGTAFLDEIGETPPAIQVKLLRFLQDGEIRPVGSTRCKHLSVRILAAAQTPLEDRIRDGRFREDLFFRLNYFAIRLPPLRERREDIPLLSEFWMRRYASEMGKPVASIDPGTIRMLREYPFPGNVRELQNMIAHAVALAPGGTLRPEDLPPPVHPRSSPPLASAGPVPRTLEDLREAKQRAQNELERAFLLQALKRCGGNVSRAAREAGVNRSVFHEMMSRHHIGREKPCP